LKQLNNGSDNDYISSCGTDYKEITMLLNRLAFLFTTESDFLKNVVIVMSVMDALGWTNSLFISGKRLIEHTT